MIVLNSQIRQLLAEVSKLKADNLALRRKVGPLNSELLGYEDALDRELDLAARVEELEKYIEHDKTMVLLDAMLHSLEMLTPGNVSHRKASLLLAVQLHKAHLEKQKRPVGLTSD